MNGRENMDASVQRLNDLRGLMAIWIVLGHLAGLEDRLGGGIARLGGAGGQGGTCRAEACGLDEISSVHD